MVSLYFNKNLGNFCVGDDTELPWIPGEITNSTGQSAWIACSPGEYSSVDRQSCLNCTVNTYSNGPTDSWTSCPTGETSVEGSSFCIGVCGDGFRTVSEDCDDGNKINGDGWSK